VVPEFFRAVAVVWARLVSCADEKAGSPEPTR
jgi:hypothetical protein